MGFPDNVVAGRTQPFKIARKCLPGPYTFILWAGKVGRCGFAVSNSH
jgi:tRNA A37 threonylcarbamoyladenosine synthetase subunit TsaC/SUA5/YrdC